MSSVLESGKVMMTEFERTAEVPAGVRRELLAGLARPVPGQGPRLAQWALEAGDWASLERVWVVHTSTELILDPPTRAGYAAVPSEIRARYPGLSYAGAMASSFDPESDRMDLDQMTAALIRDGSTLFADWLRRETAEAQVVAGTIRMLAQGTIPQAHEHTGMEGANATYHELTRVIHDASMSGGAVSARALTLFHSTASLVAVLRGDWSRARREGEFAMILSDLCSFPGFLAALVVASSSAVSGNTQHSAVAETFLATHAAHDCRARAWLDPAFHLVSADGAVRELDRRLAQHHLRLHAAEGTATRWFNVPAMHATVSSTAAMLWGDPHRALAQFDSIVNDIAQAPEHGKPWESLALRCRAQLLLSLGEVSQATQIVNDLLVNAEDSISAVPAAWFHLCAGDYARAMEKADEGIFELRISLADRAFLYAVRSAALQQASAAEELVASAAVAACLVCEQAGTLVPFAVLPSAARTYLLSHHDQHHGGADCFVTRAISRGAFGGLRNQIVASTGPIRLSRREKELLPLLATPATVQEIADQQFVSVNTVRKQVVALRAKVGAASRPDLIRRAYQLGLLTEPEVPGPLSPPASMT